ncbi:unannotated protein [freshwater metagenome]|uniref:Unannotated protein n=1 Tax=freshwater metagenome TaxID=449393 RepID=A0A6J7C301_9ZZZZ
MRPPSHSIFTSRTPHQRASVVSRSTDVVGRSRSRQFFRCCSTWVSRWSTSGRMRSNELVRRYGSTTSACDSPPGSPSISTPSNYASRTRSSPRGVGDVRPTGSTPWWWPLVSPGVRPWSCAPTPATCVRPERHSASHISSRASSPTCRWPGSSCGSSRLGSTRRSSATATCSQRSWSVTQLPHSRTWRAWITTASFARSWHSSGRPLGRVTSRAILTATPSRTSPSSSIPHWCPISRRRVRPSRSGCIAHASKGFICASVPWREAAFAGRIAARISAPRYSGW